VAAMRERAIMAATRKLSKWECERQFKELLLDKGVNPFSRYAAAGTAHAKQWFQVQLAARKETVVLENNGGPSEQ
jgi:hypothetical protein